MEQYISKSALVAEIEKFRKNNKPKENMQYAQFELDVTCGYDMALDDIEAFIDTLEVKEVDLEKAIEGLTVGWIEGEEYGELQNVNTKCCVTLDEVKEVMRCIYNLGLKAQKGE